MPNSTPPGPPGRRSLATMVAVAIAAQLPLVLYIAFALPTAAHQTPDRDQARALLADIQELLERARASAEFAQLAMDRAGRAASEAEAAADVQFGPPPELSRRLAALDEALARQSRQLETFRIAMESREPPELDSLRDEVRRLQAEATIREEQVDRLRRAIDGGPLSGLDALRSDVKDLEAEAANRSREIDDLQRALRGWTPSGLDPLRQDVRNLQDEATKRERDIERLRREIRDLDERVRRLEQRQA